MYLMQRKYVNIVGNKLSTLSIETAEKKYISSKISSQCFAITAN